MPDVPFTQYMRPNGRPVPMTIDRPESVANQAQQLLEAGFCLEAEVLTTGQVSITVSDGENDIAGELTENGPGILDAVDRLIGRAIAVMKEVKDAKH